MVEKGIDMLSDMIKDELAIAQMQGFEIMPNENEVEAYNRWLRS